MPRKSFTGQDKPINIAFRVPTTVRDRIAALVSMVGSDPMVSLHGSVSSATVARCALLRGLSMLEGEYEKSE